MEIINKKVDSFFILLNTIVKTKPYFVIIILHEYFRNLYKEDPYLKFSEKNHKKRIINTLDNLIKLLKILNKVRSYKIDFDNNEIESDLRKKSSKIFSKIFIKKNNNNHSINYFKSLKSLGLEKKYFKNKIILDAGTGAGRHAVLISKLGVKKIIAVDHKISINQNLKLKYPKNIYFREADVQNLQFKTSEFDFINCYGVLHHTNNIEKGLKELLRVLKKGGYLYLYIYGSGGVYWNSRKKMNKLFQSIPQYYTKNVLKIINMPINRFVFEDCWYAPIEKYTSQKKLEEILRRLKVQSFKKLRDKVVEENKFIWGDGELKYLITK
ncbi:MAG: class I SAM-dependent methyltransferase [Pelagibacteraceae bacterium]|jgi:ubiquinone/menaquinone biosynthesis C-methylase UbiE|nr:class I SAM-dependent methyltransferase [Pelagibacteraceae bacterium]